MIHCPLCDGQPEAESFYSAVLGRRRWYIRCPECRFCSGDSDTEKGARLKWTAMAKKLQVQEEKTHVKGTKVSKMR